MEFAELVELAGQRIIELREVLSQGNSLLNELRRVEKSITTKLERDLDAEFAVRVNSIINEGLEEYQDSLKSAIKSASDSVYKRFDDMMNTLLGEDTHSKKKGEASIEDLFLQRRQSRNALIDDVVERTLRKR
jgi:hypothetical protein